MRGCVERNIIVVGENRIGSNEYVVFCLCVFRQLVQCRQAFEAVVERRQVRLIGHIRIPIVSHVVLFVWADVCMTNHFIVSVIVVHHIGSVVHIVVVVICVIVVDGIVLLLVHAEHIRRLTHVGRRVGTAFLQLFEYFLPAILELL